MAQRNPWIFFRVQWTERARSGLVALERALRLVTAAAIDPAPTRADFCLYEVLSDELFRRLRSAAWNPTTLPSALESIGYRAPAVVAEVTETMGVPGTLGTYPWSTRDYGLCRRWNRDHPFDPAPLIALYQRHEADPPVDKAPGKRGLGLTLDYQFKLKRPNSAEPLFPGTELDCSATVMLGMRHVRIGLRYDSSEMTPALREAHAHFVATLGPKTPPHQLERILPGTRERSVPITW